MINCYGSQYAESLAYYEKIQKYIHTQANLNCPGGLEGCIANPNDVRCKMGVKYGETSGDSSILYQSLFMTLFKLFLAVFFIYLYHNYQDFHWHQWFIHHFLRILFSLNLFILLYRGRSLLESYFMLVDIFLILFSLK